MKGLMHKVGEQIFSEAYEEVKEKGVPEPTTTVQDVQMVSRGAIPFINQTLKQVETTVADPLQEMPGIISSDVSSPDQEFEQNLDYGEFLKLPWSPTSYSFYGSGTSIELGTTSTNANAGFAGLAPPFGSPVGSPQYDDQAFWDV